METRDKREEEEALPKCFGDLETVFPMGDDDLRKSPEACINGCMLKTLCLRTAMVKKENKVKVQEDQLDRAYQTGAMGFFERWAKKKELSRLKNGHKK